MKDFFNRVLLLIIINCIAAGCANIVPPTGGKKDIIPPQLLSVTPGDSLLNTKPRKLEMRFDEYITLSNASAEVQISPLLSVPLNVSFQLKKVSVRIPDTLLEENTTYRITFGGAIKDLHENNPFKAYSYIFSTGNYFDSLQLSGTVIDATTGLPDTSAFVVLYSAKKSDSAVVREKPIYANKVGPDGSFSLKGLPARRFKMYALKDANGNLIYDGGKEYIGFLDSVVVPTDSIAIKYVLKTFPEITDSGRHQSTDTGKRGHLHTADTGTLEVHNNQKGSKAKDKAKEGLQYTVAIDTSDVNKRTVEVTQPVSVTFNKKITAVAQERITLTYDSSGIAVEAAMVANVDTVKKGVVNISTAWRENTVYTLRLLKGFAKDSSGDDVLPSRFTFRTKRDEDYGKLTIHLPSRMYGAQYLLLVKREKDTIYQKPVRDTMVRLTLLKPGSYSLYVIVDKNGNGKWDTGDLFKKLQPEDIIPYSDVVQLKPGWENLLDFERIEKGKNKNAAPASAAPPQH